MNPSTSLATVVVDELVRLGLRHACLAPGSRSAPLAVALHARSEVELHVGVDERSVSFLALGVARVTRRPTVVVTTSGTAVANLLPAAVEADAARVPLLLLTADRPPELRHAGANQTIVQPGLFDTVARWSLDVGPEPVAPGTVAFWRSSTCRAWAAAMGSGGTPGPVHVNLAFREPLLPDGEGVRNRVLDGRPDGRPWTVSARPPRPLADEDLIDLAQRVTATERGLLLVGDSSVDPAPLVDLAVTAGWPLLAEPQSGARQGSTAVSTYDALLRHGPFAAAHRPDLVLRVGRSNLSRALTGWLTPDVPQILLDADGAWLDPGRALQRVVVADPDQAAAALAESVEPRPDSGWLSSWRTADGAARGAIDELLDAETAPTEPRTARDLAASLPDGAALVIGSSLPVRDLDAVMAPRTGLRVLGNRGASGIDGAVSTALGVALAHDAPVAALLGDLSLLHDRNGFLLLDERPDLALVVLQNDGGGIFEFLPQAQLADGFERLFATPHGVDLARVAAVHDLPHHLLERAEDLPGALEGQGVRLVEVRTDRGANRDLHQRLWDAVAAALAPR